MSSPEGHASLNGYGERDFKRTFLPPAAGHGRPTLKAMYQKGIMLYILNILSEFSTSHNSSTYLLITLLIQVSEAPPTTQEPPPIDLFFVFTGCQDRRPKLLRASQVYETRRQHIRQIYFIINYFYNLTYHIKPYQFVNLFCRISLWLKTSLLENIA